MTAGQLFPVPEEAWRSIFNALVYQPTKKYWDPFWQPIIRISDGTLLISPQLIVASSPQRNLITLLNRTAEGRRFYNRVSSQKEGEQLKGIASLFDISRYLTRQRVTVQRNDGTILTDIDLAVYDKREVTLLLLHAKWLIRPDSIQEVLTRDQEVQLALDNAVGASAQIIEHGVQWISNVFGENCEKSPSPYSIVVNQDFIPSGWVYNPYIPVVNTAFVAEFVSSSSFSGLTSLYTACQGFGEDLQKRHPARLASDEIQFGDYSFELPTLEPVKDI